jgi:isocitrate dehydrogenase
VALKKPRREGKQTVNPSENCASPVVMMEHVAWRKAKRPKSFKE